MKVLITGANGFLGRNLKIRLARRVDTEVSEFLRTDSLEQLSSLVSQADFIFHLAGVNRPVDPREFTSGNADLTGALAAAVEAVAAATGKLIPIVYTSSRQAEADNPYGISKRSAEQALLHVAQKANVPVRIFRLPNVFGKWTKPNYNSAVATFCHNIARGLPVQINDPASPVTLVYIDDVVDTFMGLLDTAGSWTTESEFVDVNPVYQTTVGELADTITAFRKSRDSMTIDRVGTGFLRALYSTYVSYLPTDEFSYTVPKHGDPRGVFVEMLKTPDTGQFSYFTAFPGVTRGGHYHHTKTEKFLVIKGKAHFRFLHMVTGETYSLDTSGEKPEVVETVPGWTHDITNVGTDELIVMLWANEVFDREKPDTIAAPLPPL